MKQGKFILAAALIVLLAALSAVWLLGGKAPQTEQVRVVLSIQHPPFDEYTLSGAEAGRVLEAMSKISFPEPLEGPRPMGDGTTCTVTTEKGTESFELLRPYIVAKGKLYQLSLEEELFDLVDGIVDAHRQT